MVIAHSGHWLVNVLYVAPLGGFVVWMSATEIRGRVRSRRDAHRRVPRKPRSGHPRKR